jgi:hypothetical protein
VHELYLEACGQPSSVHIKCSAVYFSKTWCKFVKDFSGRKKVHISKCDLCVEGKEQLSKPEYAARSEAKTLLHVHIQV